MTNCAHCDAPLTTEKFCPRCGTRVENAPDPAQDDSAGAPGESTPTGPILDGPDASPDVPVSTVPVSTDPAASDEAASPKRASFGRVDSQSWIAAVANAGLAYLVGWIVSLLFVLLALLSFSNAPIDWSWLFLAPAQFVALALGGTFSVGTTVLGVSASASLLWVPLLITAVVITAISFLSRRHERAAPSPSALARWALSAASGLTMAIIAVVLAAVLRPAYSGGVPTTGSFASMLGGGISGSAASVTLFFGAFVIVTFAAALARSGIARRSRAAADSSTVHATVVASIPVVALYLAVAGVVIAIVALVGVGIKVGATTLLTSPLWLPTVVLNGLAMVNFSSVSVNGTLASLPGLQGLSTAFSLPGSFPWWAVLLVVVVNLILVVFIGTVLRLRRRVNDARRAVNWLTTVGLFALTGVGLSLLGSIAVWTQVDASALSNTVGGSSSLLGGLTSSLAAGAASISATFGPAAWTFLLFAILGALVEVVAIFVAPFVLALVPASALDRIGRILRRVGVPVREHSGNSDDGAIVDGTAVADGLPAPLSPQRRRRVKIILGVSGGAVALIVLGAIAIGIVNSVVFSPQKQVENYLSSIAAHDASSALALGDIDAPNSSRALLTDKVLAATPSGISGYDITGSSTTGDVATVTAVLDQDGAKSTSTFSLHRTGNSWLFFDSWKLNTVALPTLFVATPPGIDRLTINGAAVAISDADRKAGVLRLPVFPGSYAVSLGGDNHWVSAAPKKATVTMSAVGGSQTEPVQLTLTPTAAFTTSVTEQITTWLTQCAAQTTIAPEGCPFRYYSFGDASDISWHLGTTPTFHLETSSNGGWRVSTDKDGVATVGYNYSFFGSSSSSSYDDSFGVDGSVDFTNGKPSYHYIGY
jgi:hypothetical protein